jgi:hypothetical protein
MGAVITIADVAIRQDAKGRYNLNDFHRAAGANDKHRPSRWAENQQAKDLAAELESEQGKAVNPALVLQKGGKAPGTYVARELVYAYAMWISPAFHLKVIRTFDKAMAGAIDWRKERSRAVSTTKVANDILKLVRAEAGKETEGVHYMAEAKLVNWALAGEFKGLDRDALSAEDLALLAHLEERNAVLIGRGQAYEQRKPILKAYAMDWRMSHCTALPAPTPEAQREA